ncbi:hypothetical protein [Flagellimonas okinawensis]|uniref:Quercetin 2,3-dioxygenase C-terminal cupin domain-containing protein n=1 Tax=Flagellimonas okinawensis TaxID=3031324 RepID=A0ABT5XU44_9FLAO|nr:hypothetical protein [[Muricauda] okinawensis]MDF0709076.1 hypothetical protein [[Muricauda] okinawensis]
MIAQKTARIFKSQRRNRQQVEGYQCLTTLINDDFNGKKQNPFEIFTSLNDETLAPNNSKFYYMEEGGHIILMPLVGMVEVEVSVDGKRKILIPEELQVLNMEKGQSLHISNPYDKEYVNYLQIHLTKNQFQGKKTFEGYGANSLHRLLKTGTSILNFGVFEGRNESQYKLENPNNGIFAFVINGVFEIEDRLLESRDGLALWDTDTVEMEALSENAIILLMETPLLDDLETKNL